MAGCRASSGPLSGSTAEAAKGAFTAFLDGRNPTASQIQFLDLVIDHLTPRGAMDPRLLYETPFTGFDSNGVDGVFSPADVVRLIRVLREIDAKPAA